MTRRRRNPGANVNINTEEKQLSIADKEREELLKNKELEEIAQDKEVEEVAQDKEVEEVAQDKEVEEVAQDKEVEKIEQDLVISEEEEFDENEDTKKSTKKSTKKNTKKDTKPLKSVVGPRPVIIYGKEIYIEEDTTLSLDDIRKKLVDEYKFNEFNDKSKVSMSQDPKTGEVRAIIELKKKG